MPFQTPTIKYSGRVKEVTIGTGPKAVTIGGESCYPFYLFEGEMPHAPKVAFEVWDFQPDDWPAWAVEPYKDVISDPVAWARKSVETYGAEIICLMLKSTDPNGLDRDPEEAIQVVKNVSAAVEVPLIIWGSANDEKDAVLLRRVQCTGNCPRL